MKTQKGLPYFDISEITELGWVRHGFLTRKGGVSLPPFDTLNLSGNNGDLDEHVSQNKNQIAMAFGFDLNRLILLNQVHEDRIFRLKEAPSSLPSPLEYDAMITTLPNFFLGILTADCVPIFMIDQKKRIIAAVHAGRKGTELHITTKVLKK